MRKCISTWCGTSVTLVFLNFSWLVAPLAVCGGLETSVYDGPLKPRFFTFASRQMQRGKGLVSSRWKMKSDGGWIFFFWREDWQSNPFHSRILSDPSEPHITTFLVMDPNRQSHCHLSWLLPRTGTVTTLLPGLGVIRSPGYGPI